MGSTGAGSSLDRTGGTAGAQSSTGERRVDAHSPPLGHVPSLGIFIHEAVSLFPTVLLRADAPTQHLPGHPRSAHSPREWLCFYSPR